ncbi:F-box protein (DUF295) [Arabidopsis thaliana]|uniref:Probable F-box protein At4g22060 n=1 Tax=Arabidopsis thaliana TaxID=3702 RepID=FB334_ARATH|nr:F-box protein (DUF295) [Arabidopsis thaliana]O65454.2 RecName: Full=Probable F-box protein At4g22060 [Arabidopsis thaliana]AEE84545.1 F-box protein (DUF295) [Arabidopsis thaliana]|eukprot:NP_193937.2 F-box protein (DUF295) [Arabidopsis thaliana]
MDPPSLMSDGSSWSKLPLDLLIMVFERLGFVDFQRTKSVCLAWLYASRMSAPNKQIPWLIMFPEKGKDFCLLFNSEEKEKIYRIQNLGVEFANSHCLAIYGSWLFMRDPRYKLYIMNLFTRERINLPSVESQFGRIKIEQINDDLFYRKVDDEYDYHPKRHMIDISDHILWIDDKTKDYVVMWSFECGYTYMVYCRTGDNIWNYRSLDISTVNIVYKDHKMYLYSYTRDVKVLDFCEDIPRQIFETQVNYDILMEKGFRSDVDDVLNDKKEHLVVTLNGDVLRVKSKIWDNSDVWSFCIYKLNSSNTYWEKLTSLGDEAILLDLGITVLANTIEGINRNSIYFSGYHRPHYFRFDHVWSEKDICVFNLDTQEVERPHQSICSSIQISGARWFVPNFKHI